jgi:fluoride exporter
MERLLLIGLGGALGSVLRFLTSVTAARWLGLDFPWGTLLVNVVGSFLIGVVQALALGSPLVPADVRLFVSVGILGGFTTYSSFSYETVLLLDARAWHRAWLNVALTTGLCLAVCAAGMALGRSLLAAMRG